MHARGIKKHDTAAVSQTLVSCLPRQHIWAEHLRAPVMSGSVARQVRSSPGFEIQICFALCLTRQDTHKYASSSPSSLSASLVVKTAAEISARSHYSQCLFYSTDDAHLRSTNQIPRAWWYTLTMETLSLTLTNIQTLLCKVLCALVNVHAVKNIINEVWLNNEVWTVKAKQFKIVHGQDI